MVCVRIFRIGSFEPLELSVHADATIKELAELLAAEPREPHAAPESKRLIHGGRVLSDSSPLSELACSEPLLLWMLPLDSTGSGSMEVVTTAETLGFFPLSSQPPCQMQMPVASSFIPVLRAFREFLLVFLHGFDGINDFLLASKKALALAIAALKSPAPVFESAPHVTWYGEYGCALLASELRVGVVQLRIVCLDGWTFRMHSETRGVRTHTADAAGDASSTLQIGQIPTVEYADLLCALLP